MVDIFPLGSPDDAHLDRVGLRQVDDTLPYMTSTHGGAAARLVVADDGVGPAVVDGPGGFGLRVNGKVQERDVDPLARLGLDKPGAGVGAVAAVHGRDPGDGPPLRPQQGRRRRTRPVRPEVNWSTSN